MWISPVIAIIVFYYILDKGIYTTLVALPFILLWLSSPAICTYLSSPIVAKEKNIGESDKTFLNKLARKTWSFLKNFVNKSENYFPPDNFQEHPTEKIAHRTSPTNLGLSLLANVTAYDLGYIPTSGLIDRTFNALDSMNQLERYKGHFYNWYETLTREILLPKYISTVDSGNLVGHLLVLKQALLSLESQPIFQMKNLLGLKTVLDIIQEESQESDQHFLREYSDLLRIETDKPNICLADINNLFEKISFLEEEFKGTLIDDSSKRLRWFHLLFKQSKTIRDEWKILIPWMDLESSDFEKMDFLPKDRIPSFKDISILNNKIKIHISELVPFQTEAMIGEWMKIQKEKIELSEEFIQSLGLKLLKCIELCEEFSNVEYKFLYDPPTLLSWSGSMFEYLMPLIVMPSFENTILDQTCQSIVTSQIQYGKLNEVPWGISESGYNMVDVNFNYQYKAFGIPGLGLKRGLEKDLVVSPYSCMLALIVNRRDSILNLKALFQNGFMGDFGFWEAIDYTKSRLIHGMEYSIVQSYMAHHQGMSLLSLSYVLLDQPMQKRFMSDLSLKATSLLLKEKIPRATAFYAHTSDILDPINRKEDSEIRTVFTPKTKSPEIQLLTNGSYQVMISNSGGGYSRWNDLAINRWREDAILDNYGMFLYIKDIQSGEFWSNTHQPTLKESLSYQVNYTQEKVSFFREDYGLETKTDIIISPEDDVEMRRIKITNRTKDSKTLDITSYSEISITNQPADEAHPAFSNLFVETEINPKESSLFATRRPRSVDEIVPFMFHLMNVYGVEIVSVSFETDRREFIGRGNTVVNPQSIHQDILSGKSGAVLDPIFAIRYRIRIKPMNTATIDLSYGMSFDKNECYSLMYKYKDKFIKKRAFELSLTHSQVLLRQINILESDA